MKRWLQKQLRGLGYDVVKARKRYLSELFRNRPIDHLIDVGANEGQFIVLAREAGYAGHISAFEPQVECHPPLKAHGLVNILPLALGEVAGTMEMNIYAARDFSSFHVLNQRYTAEYSRAPAIAERRKVAIVPLDQVTINGESLFLKIDTQGSEAAILRGAQHTLERVAVLQIEVPFLDIYDGGSSVSEIFALTRAAQLFPAKIFPNSITSWGALVDADVIFVRKPTQ